MLCCYRRLVYASECRKESRYINRSGLVLDWQAFKPLGSQSISSLARCYTLFSNLYPPSHITLSGIMVAFNIKSLFSILSLAVAISGASALPHSGHDHHHASEGVATNSPSAPPHPSATGQVFRPRWFDHVVRQSDSGEDDGGCPPNTDCGAPPPACPPGTDCGGSSTPPTNPGGCPPNTDCGSTPPGGTGGCPPGTDCGSSGSPGNPPGSSCPIDENCFGPVGSDDGN